MVSKQKKTLTAPAFVIIAIAAILLLFIAFVDTKNSNLSKQHIVFYHFSTNEVCSDIADYVFHTNLIEKNKLIDSFAEKYVSFNFGGMSKQAMKYIESLYETTDELIKNKMVQNFRTSYLQLLANTKNNEHDEPPLFGIGLMHSLFKVEKDCGNLPKPAIDIQTFSCKGEWQSVQIIIVPFTDTLKQIEVTLANLPFSAKNMQCFWGEYAFCNNSFYPTNKTAWIADPLIPMDCDILAKNITFSCTIIPASIPKGETRSVWLSYFVPSTVAAGNYSISIAVSAKANQKLQTQSANINLKIYDYTLPKTMHVKTAFSFDEPNLMSYYHVSKISAQQQKEYYDFLLSYHLNPMSLYNPVDSFYPPLDDWQYCIDRGANYFNIGYLEYIPKDSIGKIKDFAKTLEDKIRAIKQKNLLKYAYIYGFDEVQYRDYEHLKERYKQLRKIKIAKDIPFMCTRQPDKELAGYVDIWVPEIESFSTQTKPITKHDKLWEYVCYTNNDDYPNFYIECAAIDPRIIFWHGSKNSIEGFLYYNINNWTLFADTNKLNTEEKQYVEKIMKGVLWPNVPWIGHSYRPNDGQRFVTGDGQLVYPGKDMKLYPSLRLLSIRDGIQDYECFYQLKQLQLQCEKMKQHDKALTIDSFLVKTYGWVSFDKREQKDPAELLEIMREAKVLLERYLPIQEKNNPTN